MKYKKKISFIMVICLLINTTFASNFAAKAQSIAQNNIIYYDGQAYEITIDMEGTLSLQSISSGEDSASIIVHSDATAEVTIINNCQEENYNLDIKELDQENISLDVYDKDGENKVDEINDFSELNYDQYVGQSATGLYYVFSLSLLIEVLVTLLILVVIGGIVYYCVNETIEMIKDIAATRTKENKPQIYYIAYIQGPSVYININSPMNEAQAISRLKAGGNTYTFLQVFARNITVAASSDGTVVGPEKDNAPKEGYIYLMHYHINRNIPSHSFYGTTFTK